MKPLIYLRPFKSDFFSDFKASGNKPEYLLPNKEGCVISSKLNYPQRTHHVTSMDGTN